MYKVSISNASSCYALSLIYFRKFLPNPDTIQKKSPNKKFPLTNISLIFTAQDPAKNLYWMIRDKQTGNLTPTGIDQYQPQDGSTTVFSYEETGMSHYERLTRG